MGRWHISLKDWISGAPIEDTIHCWIRSVYYGVDPTSAPDGIKLTNEGAVNFGGRYLDNPVSGEYYLFTHTLNVFDDSVLDDKANKLYVLDDNVITIQFAQYTLPDTYHNTNPLAVMLRQDDYDGGRFAKEWGHFPYQFGPSVEPEIKLLQMSGGGDIVVVASTSIAVANDDPTDYPAKTELSFNLMINNGAPASGVPFRMSISWPLGPYIGSPVVS